MNLRVLAPGKLFIAGEYAVLDGWPAVVMAVDRYVQVFRPAGPGASGGLVESARAEAARALRADPGGGVFEADSSALYRNGAKLGLGSSAAVTVASVASVFHEAARKIEEDGTRRAMWTICKNVHDVFQKRRGSGADMAASLFGGFVAFDPSGADGPAFAGWKPPDGTSFVFVWTGQSASTPGAIGAVADFMAGDPAGCARLLRELGAISRGLARGEARDPEDLVEAFRACAGLMNELGIRSRMRVVTPAIEKVMLLAREFGGAAKPSGAGGGDFVAAAFGDAASAGAFSKAAEGAGFAVFDFAPAPRGVHAAESGGGKGSRDG